MAEALTGSASRPPTGSMSALRRPAFLAGVAWSPARSIDIPIPSLRRSAGRLYGASPSHMPLHAGRPRMAVWTPGDYSGATKSSAVGRRSSAGNSIPTRCSKATRKRSIKRSRSPVSRSRRFHHAFGPKVGVVRPALQGLDEAKPYSSRSCVERRRLVVNGVGNPSLFGCVSVAVC
jgi:hypothetical protein